MRAVPLLLIVCVAAPASALDCQAPPDASTNPLLAPAAGLDTVQPPLASLAPGLGEFAADLSLAAVRQRVRERDCAALVVDAAAGYQKRTEFDNTPYRYNMHGGKFDAAEFEAWMASRGIRIVRAADSETTAEPAAADQAGTAPVVAD